MAGKSKSKKKKTATPAPKPASEPDLEPASILAPARDDHLMARRIDGVGFWKYKAQLMADKIISLRDEMLGLRKGAAEQRSRIATLTKLISELEDQLAEKDIEIVEYEKRFLDAERADVQRGNAAVVAELQINTATHNVKIVNDCLVLEPKPREFRKR